MKEKKTRRLPQNRQALQVAYSVLGQFLYECQLWHGRHYLNEEQRQRAFEELLSHTFGDMERDGRLQKDLNRCCNNVLKHLKEDFPHFTRRRLLVFSYVAAGLPVPLIVRLAGLSYEGSIYTMKCLMKQEILYKASPWQEEYLALLHHEGLPNWGRNAIFA